MKREWSANLGAQQAGLQTRGCALGSAGTGGGVGRGGGWLGTCVWALATGQPSGRRTPSLHNRGAQARTPTLASTEATSSSLQEGHRSQQGGEGRVFLEGNGWNPGR